VKRIVANSLAVAALGALQILPAPAQTPGADAMPPYEIVTAVRSMGLNPLGRPARQGPYYVLRAIDMRGVEMRVIADSQFGDILSIQPVRQPASYNAPRYDGGPRIIQVPQGFNRAAPGGIEEDSDEPVPQTYNRRPRSYERAPSPPPPERLPQGYDRRATAPPPPPPPRAVLVPPSYRSNGPSPIKPLPKLPGAADKFLPTVDPPAAPDNEPQASADGPPAHITADAPIIPPPNPETKVIPPPEVKAPEPEKLIDIPDVAPLD
jgi:hypothetical protein